MHFAVGVALLLTALAPGASAPASRSMVASPVREAARKEVLALLAAWVAAQNAADAKTYLGFYDPVRFTGVKRTRDGGVARMDFAAWQADRIGGFRRKPVVAAERPEVSTWLDPGSRLDKGVVTIRFLQRWRTTAYADHGIKLLQLGRPRPGQWRILYEDLVNSDPGWGTPGDGVGGGGAKIASDQDALAYWNRLPLSAATYEALLAKLPADPAARRFLARALVKGGNFDCTKTVELESHGDHYEEWADLEPTATFADPCLRLRLVRWAVGPGLLTIADRTELAPILKSLFALPAFETEIPEAVLVDAAKLPEKVRLEWLAALVAGEHGRLAERNVKGLSQAGLAKAYAEFGLDEAALGLELPAALDLVIKAAGDERMENQTRVTLIERLAEVLDARVTAALKRQLREPCNVAMAAIAALTARNVPGLLPTKPKSSDPEKLGQALCLILNDKDPARQAAALTPFLPPRGTALVAELTDNGSFIEEVAPGKSQMVGHVSGPKVKIRRGQALPSRFSVVMDLESLACELITYEGSLQGAIVCETQDSSDTKLTVELRPAKKSGEFFVSEIVRLTDNTCTH